MRFIFPTILIIISGVIFVVVADPLYKDIKQLKEEVSTYNVALSNSNELQDTRDSLVDVYKNVTKENRDRLEHLLPSSINNIELILEIEKIASLQGMPIKNIKFESEDKENNTDTTTQNIISSKNSKDSLPYGIFPMEFVIEGKYNSFISFLENLEQNLRLVDVRSISFSVPTPATTADDKTDKSIYSYTLKVETYWLK